MNRDIAYGAWTCETPNREVKLIVEVKPNGDIYVTQGDTSIVIKGVDVRDAFWLADVMRPAAEMSKARPLDI